MNRPGGSGGSKSGPGRIHVGTSGWNYEHWVGRFYPADLPRDRWLEHYAGHFESVEINNSFYQLPHERSLHAWKDTVGQDFVFSVKASRYVTHMKKLKDAAESSRRFVERVESLGRRLGPLLFQLPPRWNFDPERLDDFLDAMGARHRIAVEPRDHSWFDERAYDLLRVHGAALCIYELDGFESPREATADFVYIRLHGPGAAYEGSYDARTLQGWAGAISSWASSGRDVFCYFDNDEQGYAAQNALELKAMLD